MSSSVYGEVAEMPPAPGTVIFIAVLGLITALEFLFSYLQRVAARNDCEEIYSKLKEELMLLGIISFTVFVFESAATEELVNNEWFESFDLAHILILFIAIAFIVQALFLVQYATNSGRRYLLALRTSVSDLLDQFKVAKQNGIVRPGTIELMFSYFNDSRDVANLFNNIEFKIVERRFFSIHAGKVPAEFDFAKYVSKLFHTYIAEIGEVSPESWMMLAALVALNLVRVYGIDPVAVESTCGEAEEEGEICAEYYIQYGFVCGIILNICILSIFLASRSYMNTLIADGIANSGLEIPFNADDPVPSYEVFLEKLKRIEDENQALVATSPRFGGVSKDHGAPSPKRGAPHNWKSVAQTVGVVVTLGKEARYIEEAKAVDYVSAPKADKKMSMQKMIEKQQAEEHEKAHLEELNKSKPCTERMWIAISDFFSSFFEVEKNPEIDKIYWLAKPYIYFKGIEFAFLLQCFYIAMYLTQLLPLTGHTEYCALWVVVLTLPIIFGFFVFRQILTKAVMLHAMNGLHKEVVARVCDEVIEEETICDEVRGKIQKEMQVNFVAPEDEVAFIRRKFNQFDTDGSKSIDHDEFRKLLGTLNAYLTIEKFDILWKVIDFDLSGEVTWDEVFVFVFPERKREMKEELRTIDELRIKFVEDFKSKNIPSSEWEANLKRAFEHYDADHSQSIEKQEFRKILESFNLIKNERAFHTVFAAIDTDAGGGISWEEFKDLILPDLSDLPLSTNPLQQS